MRSTASSWKREIFKYWDGATFWCSADLQVGILGLCRAEARHYEDKPSHYKVSRVVRYSAMHGILLSLATLGISCLAGVARAQQYPPPTNVKAAQPSAQAFAAMPVAVAASGSENASDISHSNPTLASTKSVSSSNSKIPSPKSLPPALSPATTALLKGSQAFIENRGQFPERVRFQLKTGGQTLWLTNQGIVFDAIRSKRLPAGSKTPSKGSGDFISPQVQAIQSHNGDVKSPLLLGGPSLALNPAPRLHSIDTSNLERLVFSQDFVGAHCSPSVEAIKPQPGIYNYFFGNDPKKWTTHVKRYEAVVYRDLWDGIDLKLYPNGSNLEQEFIIRPGGDLAKVKVSYQGVASLKIADDGALIVRTAFGELRETKPRIYQEIAGKRVPVDGKFKLTSETAYTFQLSSYQPQYALVIDPTLLYSTFLGGSAYDVGNGIAVDSSGNVYVTGYTSSTNFPTTPGAFDSTYPGTDRDAFVTKLNPIGSRLVYSTFVNLGGGSAYGCADATGIAIDSSGSAYITGCAGGGGFPTTANAYQTTCGDSPFMAKLSPAGDSLVYSTCLGVPGYGFAVAVGPSGLAYITGQASNSFFPVTAGAYQSSSRGFWGNAFFSVLDPSASGTASLVYSTYLGGSTNKSYAFSSDEGFGIAVDAFGMAYITGQTVSTDFPVTPGAFQTIYPGSYECSYPTIRGCPSAFVAKLNPFNSGVNSLIYSTFLGGGAAANGAGIAVDSSGNAYVAGVTSSGGSPFPTTAGAYQSVPDYGGDAFMTKFNAAGNKLVYSTLLGPSQGARGIALDLLGDAYVTGYTGSGFPVTANAFQPTLHSVYGNAFLTEFNATGSALVYSSYLGGSGCCSASDVGDSVAVDPVGDAYVAGFTYSFDFPVTPFAFQPIFGGGGDAFVTKFPLGAPGGLSVAGIAPAAGGNAGTVSPEIVGTGLHAGANVQLACGGGANISATNLSVGVGGRIVDGTFNLVGTSPGTCDVVVTNPDGSSTTLSGAFAVQQGGAPDLKLYLTGVAAREAPFEQPVAPTNAAFFAVASNVGDVDSAPVIVSEPVPPPFTVTSTSPVGSGGAPPSDFEVWVSAPIAAGSSQMFTSTATATSNVGSPVVAQACVQQNPSAVAACLQKDALSAGVTCFGAGVLCGACVGVCSSGIGSLGCPSCIVACLAALAKCGLSGTNCQGTCTPCPVPVSAPSDPNSLLGPPGVGGERWTGGAQGLTYGITFGNEPNASVPAQQVVVAQPLGPNVNLASLTVSGITIPNGNSISNVPISVPPGAFKPVAGVNEFVTNVDLRPSQNLFVLLDAKLNPNTSTLTWTFTSIDASTGLPPANPLVGFLPPGTSGSVSFSVRPNQGLATGTQVTDQASIVFDTNPAMTTPTWINTIDNTPPTTRVSSLPATVSCPDFKVSWSGSDVGSGTKGFTILVSDNGGPYQPWLTNTNATSMVYQGQLGHTYSFYSLAQDLVGNVEAAKTSPEATTQVTATGGCGAPSISGGILSQQNVSGTLTLNLQFTDTGTSDADNVSINHISFRTLAGTGSATLASPALPISVGNISVGSGTPVTLTLNVPTTVTRFSITEGGTLKNTIGTTYNFSIAQLVSP